MKVLRITTIGAAALLLVAGGTLAQSRVDQTQLNGSSAEPTADLRAVEGQRGRARVEFRVVNVRDLAQFPTGSTVGPEEFDMAGVLRGTISVADALTSAPLPASRHQLTASRRTSKEEVRL